MDAMPHAQDTHERLDVEVHELAGVHGIPKFDSGSDGDHPAPDFTIVDAVMVTEGSTCARVDPAKIAIT